MLRFTNEDLTTILKTLKDTLSNLNEKDILEFEVIDPDITTSTYNGTIINLNNEEFIYRQLSSWVDLADILFCKPLIPIKTSNDTIIIRYEKLQREETFHKNKADDEKYGKDSTFWKINKNEEPAFLHYYIQALENVKIDKRVRILNLGVNNGDEFEIIKSITKEFKSHEIVGIDYCQSAIDDAKEKFKNEENITFYKHDINKLETLDLGEFDLIITIGTLQSSNLNFKPLFMDIVQKYLKKEGSLILGFPNCRWIDGTYIFGANTKNYSFPEYSVLYNDVIFCKKYLQQKKFRVTITGKNYIFLTASSIK